MHRKYVTLFIILLGFLCGCNMDKIPDALIPEKENEFAINYINKLFAGDTSYCLSEVGYDDLTDEGRNSIIEASTYLKSKRIESHRLYFVKKKLASSTDAATKRYTSLKYEYKADDEYINISIVLSGNNDKFKISGFQTSVITKPTSEQYEFSFRNKTILHYVLFVSGALFLVFKIVTLVVAIKTPLPRKGWWIVFILFSFITFYINWTTGETSSRLLYFDLIGFSIEKSEKMAQWVLSVSVPVGAILFWRKRRNLKLAEEADKRIAESSVMHEDGNDAGNDDVMDSEIDEPQ